MGIQEELVAELQDAMRARDKPRASVIRQVQTEVAVAKSAPGFTGELDDELYTATIASYVKKMERRDWNLRHWVSEVPIRRPSLPSRSTICRAGHHSSPARTRPGQSSSTPLLSWASMIPR